MWTVTCHFDKGDVVASFDEEQITQDFVATMVCKMYGDQPGNNIKVRWDQMDINYRKRWNI